MSPIKLLVTGCRGRMGRAVIDCAGADPELTIAARIDLGDALAPGLKECDTVIDFSHHSFIGELAPVCAREGKGLVIGTTGHDAAEVESIRRASTEVPVVFAPNFSVGVNTLFWLTRQAAAALGSAFDLEVVEMHHNRKIDAPSGTAKRLAEILCEVNGLSYGEDVRHGRAGDVGARSRREVGMHALRGGDVVGDHTVIFAAEGERLELTHRAASRQTFARGALRAAKWLRGKSAGLYDMQDVLGLR
jgi:4-hydroxy-tetrahydrodipicolinate reductase